MSEVLNIAAIVLAAGEGRRMQLGHPKQFLMLGGRPLFLHSLAFFLRLPEVKTVCLVLNEQALEGEPAELARETARDYSKQFLFARGGARRQDSVLSGLRALPQKTDIVLVHDSARPFPPLQPVRQSIAEAAAHGGAILAAPVRDTVKQVGEGLRIQQTLERDRLYLAQTPQTFRYPELLSAMEDVERNGLDITDEAMAFERLGREVRIVPATANNLKVTVPEDLPRAEQLLVSHAQESAP